MNRLVFALVLIALPSAALAADPEPDAPVVPRRVHVDIKDVAVDHQLELELARNGFIVTPSAKGADVHVTGKLREGKPTKSHSTVSLGVGIDLVARQGKNVIVETGDEGRATAANAKLARPIAIASASRHLFPRFAFLLAERLGFAAGVPYDENRPGPFDVQLGVAFKKGMVTIDEVQAGQKKLECTLKTMGYNEPRPVDGVIRRPPCEPDSPEDDRGAPGSDD